jgi:hypothetical protein
MDLKQQCVRLWPHRIHKAGIVEDVSGDFAKTVKEWTYIF